MHRLHKNQQIFIDESYTQACSLRRYNCINFPELTGFLTKGNPQ
jgi:hypothetical protein